MSEQDFGQLYPAPWRISDCGQEVQDANGDHVNGIDGDDPDERLFWQDIIEGVNERALRLIETAPRDGNLLAASRAMYVALKGAIGALEFSRDYHRDLGNADQAFCQDKLDAAAAAISLAEAEADHG